MEIVKMPDVRERLRAMAVVPSGAPAQDLATRIAEEIRRQCSARHVPDEILVAPAIPHTLTGKRLEVPVKKLLRGTPLERAANPASVDDPAVLRWYERFAAERRG